MAGRNGAVETSGNGGRGVDRQEMKRESMAAAATASAILRRGRNGRGLRCARSTSGATISCGPRRVPAMRLISLACDAPPELIEKVGGDHDVTLGGARFGACRWQEHQAALAIGSHVVIPGG